MNKKLVAPEWKCARNVEAEVYATFEPFATGVGDEATVEHLQGIGKEKLEDVATSFHIETQR